MGREYEGTFRETFVVDANGMIEHIIEKVDTKNAASQIMELVK
jgi:peroxiredoxin Q/BCP